MSRRATWARAITAIAIALPCGAVAAPGCSLGQGEGSVFSPGLYAADCILPCGDDPNCNVYNLDPDFFAAVPFRETIQIRIQRGNDINEFSDGLAVLVSDIDTIRAHLEEKRKAAEDAGAPPEEVLETFVEVPVAIPAGVVPDGTPIAPPPPCDPATQLCDVAPVAMSLYLQLSCHNQNIVLYGLEGSIRFASLFSGDPNEKSAAEKLIYVPSFDITIGDPREAPTGVPLGASSMPRRTLSKLMGNFRFFFQRGRPGQPFPG